MKKNTVLLIIMFYTWLLTGCISTSTHYSDQPESYYDTAFRYYQQGEFETSYKFFEYYFNQDSSLGSQSIKFVRANPSLFQAGLKTFSPKQLGQKLSSDKERILDIAKYQRKRLLLFKRVAPENLYKQAKSHYEQVFPGYFSHLENIEKEAEQAKLVAKAQQELAEKQKDIARIKHQKELLAAQEKAKVICYRATECKKAFSHTQIFIHEHSTVRIQLATDTIIETYHVTDNVGMGMKAIKSPLKGSKEEIALSLYCKPEKSEQCDKLKLNLYQIFPQYIKDKL